MNAKHFQTLSDDGGDESPPIFKRLDKIDTELKRHETLIHDLRRWQSFCYGVAAAVGFLLGLVLWIFERWSNKQ